MMQPTHRWPRTLGAAAAALACTLLSGGCGMSTATNNTIGTSASPSSTVKFGGIVHGGQNPVFSATVTLWAAGTTGTYGTGATSIATTTTDTNGNFTFNNATGASPCTTGQYLYITAVGGNSGAGTNNSIAMMAALPQPCGASTAGTVVWIDEVSTVAAVTALQQFMSINTSYTPPYGGTGTVPWSIGAPSTNVTGLANAFTQSGNLVATSTGISAVSTATNIVGANSYSTTITPDFNKINGLANIMSICVNDSTGNNCTGAAGVLTLSAIVSGTNTITPKDTIQAAYNMATLPNPYLSSTSGTPSYWKATSSTTYLAQLWALITPQPPFNPYSATAPNDTAIGVNWKTVTGSTTVGTIAAASIAVDKSGNLWTASGTGGATANIVTQFNPAGQVLQTVSTVPVSSYTFSFYADSATVNQATTTANSAVTLTYGRPFSLAIDTNNNAWFGSYNNTPTTVATALTGFVAEISQSGATTGWVSSGNPGTLAIDGSNNIFTDGIPTSGRYYITELSGNPIPTSAPSTAYESLYEGIGRGTGIYNGLAIDANNYFWASTGSATCTNFVVVRGNDALLSSGASSSTVNVTLPSQCAYNFAPDASGNAWATGTYSGTAGSLMYIDINCGSCTPAAPIVTGLTAGTGTSNGGLDAAAGLAVDGSGNVWVADNVSSTTGGLSEFAVSVNSTSGVASVTPLSPAGSSAAVYGFGSSYGWLHANGAAIDSSGNVWINTTAGSLLNYIVGVASPVVTPIASAVATGKLGARP